MENFLSRLNRNPYAPIDGASVTKFDELGNGYDDFGNLIAPKFQAPEQSWGETALGVATAPARMTMGLVESLSPYGADGWQMPPIVNEGVNALTAVGDAYTGKMPEDQINSRALGMAGFMMGGGGPALALERSLAQRGINSTADMIPTAVKDYGTAKYLNWKYPDEPAVDPRNAAQWKQWAETDTRARLRNNRADAVNRMNQTIQSDMDGIDAGMPSVFNDFTDDMKTLTPQDTGYMNALLQSRKPEFDVIDGGLLNRISSAYAPDDQLNMFGGRNAKTANLERLAIAERLAAEGADRNAIWNETGWFQGPDQKWRFEIDDSNARMRPEFLNEAMPKEYWPLQDAVQHQNLYDAYPEFANGKFIKHETFPLREASANAYHIPKYNEIALNNNKMGWKQDALSNVLHEGQHIIQGAEGFGVGGSQTTMAAPLNSVAAWEARLPVVVRSELDARGIGKLFDSDPRWPEIRESIRQRIEDDTGQPFNFRAIPGMDGMDAASMALEQARNFPAATLNQIAMQRLQDTGYRDYKRLAGEVEARNVQTRMNMSADERRATPPWETQDIPFEDQIVRLYSNASKEGALPALMSIEDQIAAVRQPVRINMIDRKISPERFDYNFEYGGKPYTAYGKINGKSAEVDYIGGSRENLPNTLGPSNIRQLMQMLREDYPEVSQVSGSRASGARNPYASDELDYRQTLDLYSNADSRPALLAGMAGQEVKPLRGYHGTSEPIVKFDPSIRGETTGAESAKNAFWFSKSPDLASDYSVLAGHGPLAATERELRRFEDKARAGEMLTPDEAARARELYALREAQLQDAAENPMMGANVLPVDLEFKNPLVHDFKGGPYRDESYSSLVSRALDGGHDGLVLRNTYDPAFPLNGREMTDIYGAIKPNTVRSATTGEILYSNADSKPALLAGAIGGEQRGMGLDMSTEARLARADAMGMDTPLYHATSATQPFDEFQLGRPTFNSDVLGAAQPTNRHAVFVSPDREFVNQFAGDEMAVMPLRGNLGKTLDASGGLENALPPDFYARHGLAPDMYTTLDARNAWQAFDGNEGKAFRDALVADGYGSVKLTEDALPNDMTAGKIESGIAKTYLARHSGDADSAIAELLRDMEADPKHASVYKNVIDAVRGGGASNNGAVSYAILDPRSLRSANAAFDPAKSNSANILAANADTMPAILGGGIEQPEDILRRLGYR